MVLGVIATAAVLALAAPATAQVPNTWSGTWINSAPDGTFWVFTQNASGQSASGVWKGNASAGTLSGNISGSTLTGTLVNNEAGQSANFTITLAPDGHSFSGSFTVIGGSTGQWQSGCGGGACLNNTAPPAPPPIVPLPPPGPVAPPPQTSPKLLAAATLWGQAGPAVALGPGGQAIASSPPIASKQRSVSVTVDDGTLASSVIFNIGTGLVPGAQPKPKPKNKPKPTIKRGDCVRAAAGRALARRRMLGYTDLTGAKDDEIVFGFLEFMGMCLELVERLEAQAGATALSSASSAQSCNTRAYPLTLTVDSAKKRVSFRTERTSRRAPSRLVRTSCKRSKDGMLTFSIRTRSRRTKLRKLVGPRLTVGVHRSARASGTADVRTTFKR
jgi:hypothetical protein